MLLQVPELIPSSPFTNSLLKFFTKHSWSTLGKFLYNPLLNYLSKSMENVLGACCGISSGILIKYLLHMNGKCSWSLLGQILQVPPFVNPH